MFDFVEKFVVDVCSSSEKDHAVLKGELNLGRKTDILLKLISEMPTINQESGAVSGLMSAISLHSLVKALVDYSRSLSAVSQQDGTALLDRGVSFSKIMVEHDGIVDIGASSATVWWASWLIQSRSRMSHWSPAKCGRPRLLRACNRLLRKPILPSLS